VLSELGSVTLQGVNVSADLVLQVIEAVLGSINEVSSVLLSLVSKGGDAL